MGIKVVAWFSPPLIYLEDHVLLAACFFLRSNTSCLLSNDGFQHHPRQSCENISVWESGTMKHLVYHFLTQVMIQSLIQLSMVLIRYEKNDAQPLSLFIKGMLAMGFQESLPSKIATVLKRLRF